MTDRYTQSKVKIQTKPFSLARECRGLAVLNPIYHEFSIAELEYELQKQ